MASALVVKVTAGADAPERCSQAFTIAAAGVASGLDVSLWLTGEATWLAVPGRAEEFELDQAEPMASLIDTIMGDGTITVCAQCAARRGLTEDDLIAGIGIAGAIAFVSAATEADTQALVY